MKKSFKGQGVVQYLSYRLKFQGPWTRKGKGFEDPQITQPRENLNNYKPQNHEPVFNSFNGHGETLQKEHVVADPNEAAVLLLPVTVRERLLRILRLGIATRYNIEVESLANLAVLPESTAILVLDQFMLSDADERDKGAYFTILISKYQVDKLGLNHLPSSLSRLRDPNVREQRASLVVCIFQPLILLPYM